MAKHRVLLITQNFYPEIGSAGNRMKNIFQLLQQEEYDVKVLTTEPSYPNKNIYSDEQFWDDRQMNENQNVHRISVRNRKYSINMFNRLIYYIEVATKMLFLKCFTVLRERFFLAPPLRGRRKTLCLSRPRSKARGKRYAQNQILSYGTSPNTASFSKLSQVYLEYASGLSTPI